MKNRPDFPDQGIRPVCFLRLWSFDVKFLKESCDSLPAIGRVQELLKSSSVCRGFYESAGPVKGISLALQSPGLHSFFINTFAQVAHRQDLLLRIRSDRYLILLQYLRQLFHFHCCCKPIHAVNSRPDVHQQPDRISACSHNRAPGCHIHLENI